MVPTKKRTYLSFSNTEKRKENAANPTASWIDRYQALWKGIRTVCLPDEIINPASGRCVKRSGKIGKGIMRNAVRHGKSIAANQRSWAASRKKLAVAAQREASKKIRKSIRQPKLHSLYRFRKQMQDPVEYLERRGGVRFNIR